MVSDTGQVDFMIKEYRHSEEDIVVDFAIRSWAPVHVGKGSPRR